MYSNLSVQYLYQPVFELLLIYYCSNSESWWISTGGCVTKRRIALSYLPCTVLCLLWLRLSYESSCCGDWEIRKLACHQELCTGGIVGCESPWVFVWLAALEPMSIILRRSVSCGFLNGYSYTFFRLFKEGESSKKCVVLSKIRQDIGYSFRNRKK